MPKPPPPTASGGKRGRPKGSKNRPKGAAKWKRIKAYGGAQKSNMAAARRPFTEGKTRTGEEVYLELTTAAQTAVGGRNPAIEPAPMTDGSSFISLPLLSFNYMKQGTEEDCMIGRAVFSRYLKCKIRYIFPSAANLKATAPAPSLYQIHGFVKDSPTNKPTDVPSTVGWTITQDRDFVKRFLQAYFDERADRMRFIPKRESEVKILGYREIVPTVGRGIALPPTAHTSDSAGSEDRGVFKDMNTSVSWPLMRKTHYEQSNQLIWLDPSTGESPASTRFHYINHGWRPFLILYCPQMNPDAGSGMATAVADNLPLVNWNDIHYYTDA